MLLLGCAAGREPVTPEIPADGGTPEQLRGILEDLGDRADAAAWVLRGRIHARLRENEGPEGIVHLSAGDGADVEVLAGAAAPAAKLESVGRLVRHLRERAAAPGLCRTRFAEPLGLPLRTHLLRSIVSHLSLNLGNEERLRSLDDLAASAQKLSETDGAGTEAREFWLRKAGAAAREARDLRAGIEEVDSSAEERAFVGMGVTRHLEEAGRAADGATREMAARGDRVKVVDGYLRSLEHYVLARESLHAPTAAQDGALSKMEIVFSSLSSLLSPGGGR